MPVLRRGLFVVVCFWGMPNTCLEDDAKSSALFVSIPKQNAPFSCYRPVTQYTKPKTQNTMKRRFLFTISALVLLSLLPSCNGSDYEFAPYKGCRWQAPYGDDTLCLELLTASDVQLTSKTSGKVLACGLYDTHRSKFPFTAFQTEIKGVQYRFAYALFNKELDMVLYGDSLNLLCDTVPVAWSLPFCHFVER